jgi:hypothetical protein
MEQWYFTIEMVSFVNKTSIVDSNVKFIVATFHENTWKTIHLITIYSLPKMQVPNFISILKTILQKKSMDCPTIIIEDFNIDMATNTLQWMELQNLMYKYLFTTCFLLSPTIYNTRIGHIWTNALIQQCNFGWTEAYWTNYKPIHIAFNTT